MYKMNKLILLPIHLFRLDIIKNIIKTHNIQEIILCEEPIYFGMRTVDNKIPNKSNPPLNFNKLKLIYHKSTMTYYYDYLKKNIDSVKIQYIEYHNLLNIKNYAFFKKDCIMFDPIDSLVIEKYTKISKTITYLDTPLFLCSTKDLEEYHSQKKTKDSYFHASFYTWQRSRLNILKGSKTYDTQNRNPLPLNIDIPNLPYNDSIKYKKIIIESIDYVEKYFKNNLSPVNIDQSRHIITPDMIHFPITHDTTLSWVKDFCVQRLENFGKYEDSIDSRPKNFLFHSCISPMINIGLITPEEIIHIITDYYNKNKTKIGIANYEGFIRQVIGWREYQRYIYKYAGEKMRNSNFFNNTKSLSSHWYSGTLGIKPVDDAIKLAIGDGYIHHILRLMVVGNFMNLCSIHPHQVYKWFMEFSLDSYDWVMIGNVYSMALWADGGLTMRKPYISGDGYILKMGNYKKEDLGQWQDIWNSLLHHFIDKNSDKLSHTYYNGLVKAWKKKSSQEKEKELKLANEFISKYC